MVYEEKNMEGQTSRRAKNIFNRITGRWINVFKNDLFSHFEKGARKTYCKTNMTTFRRGYNFLQTNRVPTYIFLRWFFAFTKWVEALNYLGKLIRKFGRREKRIEINKIR